MKLVLIGIQGSGKSTQGNMLSKHFKIPYLSTGHIFRSIAKEKTILGKQVKVLMSSGLLIPDALTIEIVNGYLSRPEYKNGYILDGFPRTLTQTKKFKNNVDKVIYIEIPDKEALWRLAYRTDERNDNTVKAVLKRIELFHKHTEQVIGYYRDEKKLVSVDGTKSIEEVNEAILKSLGKKLVLERIATSKIHRKSIIAIVGMSGSGKSVAATYFKEKGIPIVSFSAVINSYIDEHKLKHTESLHHKLRTEYRKKHGMEAMAVLNKENIEEALEKKSIVVIEGLYSWEEYTYLQKEFPEVKIHLLALFTDKAIRYQRVSKRKYRSGLSVGAERDIHELTDLNKGQTIAFADFLIKNNFSKEDLYSKLDDVYRQIYFA
ncbi:MAG: nucleoside monophosphate kinase [Candidatus Roizmanbacteria bacterium]|nr:nucleoside monophosphate kinase [Candidatus Roizmanbacteria bacterium]